MKKTEPNVSIIVPVYNTSKYLERCLNSILSQDYSNFEIICINDGSTDNSLEILERYSRLDKRIKVINQANQGLSSVRNHGILIARSKYIMFVDSDDSIDKEMVGELYSSIIKDKSQIVISGYKYLDENNMVLRESLVLQNSIIDKINFFEKTLSFELSPSCCICIYKKNLFIDNKLFFTNGIYYEDLDFQYKAIFFSNKTSQINTRPYKYYKNRNSISNIVNQKNIEDMFLVLKNTVVFLKNKNIYEEYKLMLLVRIYKGMSYILGRMQKNTDYSLLDLIWIKANSLYEFSLLPKSKKLHLIFITLNVANPNELINADFFGVEESVFNKVVEATKRKEGLMHLLTKNSNQLRGKDVYIYGGGEILQSIYNSLNDSFIKISGVIDREPKEITLNNEKIKTQPLTNSELKDNYIVIIASISFLDEINKSLVAYSKEKKININIVKWDEYY